VSRSNKVLIDDSLEMNFENMDEFSDFDIKNVSFWDVFEFDSLHMPSMDIAAKTVGKIS